MIDFPISISGRKEYEEHVFKLLEPYFSFVLAVGEESQERFQKVSGQSYNFEYYNFDAYVDIEKRWEHINTGKWKRHTKLNYFSESGFLVRRAEQSDYDSAKAIFQAWLQAKRDKGIHVYYVRMLEDIIDSILYPTDIIHLVAEYQGKVLLLESLLPTYNGDYRSELNCSVMMSDLQYTVLSEQERKLLYPNLEKVFNYYAIQMLRELGVCKWFFGGGRISGGIKQHKEFLTTDQINLYKGGKG